MDDKQFIAREVTRRLNNPNQQMQSKAEITNSSDQSIRDNVIDLLIARGVNGKQVEANLRIKFISANSNKQSMIKTIEQRALDIAKKSPLIQKTSDKKELQVETLNYLSKHLECYQGLIDDEKDVPLNPQMALVFNSERRVLEMPGFPMLMKEIAEFFESGRL